MPQSGQEEFAVGKAENLVVGLLIGAALGAAAAYIFGPSRGTTFDANYHSRWDRALAEGKEAEVARKAALEQELAEAKRRHTPGQAT